MSTARAMTGDKHGNQLPSRAGKNSHDGLADEPGHAGVKGPALRYGSLRDGPMGPHLTPARAGQQLAPTNRPLTTGPFS
jgi:hypothetical protein